MIVVNIIIDFKVITWKGVDWINLARDRDQWQAFVNIGHHIKPYI
jgi:hypothetical protein